MLFEIGPICTHLAQAEVSAGFMFVDTAALRGVVIIACLETPVQLVFLESLIDLPRDDIHTEGTDFLCLQLPCIAQDCILSQK